MPRRAPAQPSVSTIPPWTRHAGRYASLALPAGLIRVDFQGGDSASTLRCGVAGGP